MHLTAAAIARELKVALRPKGNIYLTEGVGTYYNFSIPSALQFYLTWRSKPHSTSVYSASFGAMTLCVGCGLRYKIQDSIQLWSSACFDWSFINLGDRNVLLH